MEMGLLHDFLRISPCEVKDIIFAWRAAGKVRLKTQKLRRVKGVLELSTPGNELG